MVALNCKVFGRNKPAKPAFRKGGVEDLSYITAGRRRQRHVQVENHIIDELVQLGGIDVVGFYTCLVAA